MRKNIFNAQAGLGDGLFGSRFAQGDLGNHIWDDVCGVDLGDCRVAEVGITEIQRRVYSRLQDDEFVGGD